ncbi:MAG: cation-translocating P-type ATPase, partial [Coriobacteriales bacterium]|nr:cation-translocating P-type ATPase [Coriobacteriales bacterium]
GHEHEIDEHELQGAPTFSYGVLGVDCPSCATYVQSSVRTLDCVADARLVYVTATLDVVAAEGVDVTDCKRQVLQTVRSCGEDLDLQPEEQALLEAERSWYAQNREKVLMLFSAVALVAGLVTDHLMHSEARAAFFYVLAAVAGLVFVAPMAFAALRRKTADMNVLMAIAVIGALVIGFTGDPSVFGDAAIVIFLAQVGEWLEGWSMRKTSGSVRELMDLAPAVAHVVTPEGGTVDVQTKGVEEGYTIRVLPGERVPLDGVIVEGESSFNEAPVTGESAPQDKGMGAEVFAGSLNVHAVVDVRVTADEDCTTLARIVSQVQGAQAAKAPYESFVNRFAAVYTPVVVAGAIVLGIVIPAVLWVVQGGFDAGLWHRWAYRACSLLVVACPCALVISTPVSFVSALSCAARNGVLVKGGAFFDIATKVSALAFDKTGTLTTGVIEVSEVVPLGPALKADVLSVAAALEAGSTHPLAKAVVQAAGEQGAPRLDAAGVSEVVASGMRGVVAGEVCTVGKRAFAQESATIDASVAQRIDELAQGGATVLVVTRAGSAFGLIALRDCLQESVPRTVESLRQLGQLHTLEMLTGDNTQTAQAVAQAAGITQVSVELLPEQKLNRIAQLQDEGNVVAMVGDGINDAPALAQADLGITMGAAASDTALEVADVALMANGLEQLPTFFGLAHKTMAVVRENIAFAIGVKVLVFVLVVLGVAGMGAAVFADTGVALLVVLNGMRLMRSSKVRW